MQITIFASSLDRPLMGPVSRVLAVVIVELVTLLAYWPGLGGQFVFDDWNNIVHSREIQIDRLSWENLNTAIHSGNAGPLGRPLAVLTFALDHVFFGMDPWWFKLTNLAIHLLNGLLFFWVNRQLADHLAPQASPKTRLAFSITATAIWLLHPLNLSPVLYVVQRMASMAATFTLLGTGLYLYGRKRNDIHGWIAIIIAFLCTIPAAYSKENGLLLPALLFVIEWIILGSSGQKGRKRLLIGIYGILLGVPLITVSVHTILHPEWITAGYANRDFTLTQRLLTESRVLWFYLSLFLIPDISRMGLFHEDIPVSQDFFHPLSTLPAVMGIAFLIMAVLIFRKTQPLLAFGLAWFLVGHSMESSIFPLQLVHEHRNYIPLLGLSAMAAWYLVFQTSKLSLNYRIAIIISLIAGLLTATTVRASLWGNTPAQIMVEVQNHARSAATAYEAGRVMLRLAEQTQKTGKDPHPYLDKSISLFERAASHGHIGGLYGQLLIASAFKLGNPETLLKELRQRLAKKPIEPINFNSLPSLSNCQAKGLCRLTPDQLWSLYESALNNPRLKGPRRALWLSLASRYAIRGLKDYDLALSLAGQAAEIAPFNGCARIEYINLLYLIHAVDQADEEMSKALRENIDDCQIAMRDLKHRIRARQDP